MPRSTPGLPGVFAARIRIPLRQGQIAYPWTVTGVITQDLLGARLVVNAIRDAGAAMEMTSTAYPVADHAAAVAKAHAVAQAHGCESARIIAAPVSLVRDIPALPAAA